MAKKEFGQGFDIILRNEEESQNFPKPSEIKDKTYTSSLDKKHKKATKVTVRINDFLLSQVKELAYWDRKTVTEIIDDALTTHIKANISKIQS